MKEMNAIELKHKVIMALVDKGVFKTTDNPKVTKFQGGFFHLKSDTDSGKAKLINSTIEYDMVKFGNGKTSLIEQRNSENQEVKMLIEKFNIKQSKMASSIFVYDRKSDTIKEFEMKTSFDKMNNGIKAMQLQRVKFHMSDGDLILNTNLDRYIQ